ncbi:MAG: arabinose efflux permease family protein [Pedosphaera sp.]|nr:arabinose efflux permease family protein [Pedosphaera sp.]
MSVPRYFSAFSSRNYRLYFAGQVISLIGTWMTQTASLWLAYSIKSSALLLGVVGFASQIPMFILAPFAGVWIDRVNRHRLLIVTQFLSMLQSLGLAAFAYTGTINAHILIAMSLVQGVINAFDMPVRQALVVEFIEKKEHLGNAIALNSSMFNLARLVGPAIGGFVIAASSVGTCYLVDGISYGAVLAGLFMMRIQERPRPVRHPHPWTALKEGFHYAFGFAPIRALIVVVGLVSFAGFSYAVLTPVFARDIFHGDARTLGYLMASSGIGALMGALYLGTRSTVRGLGLVIAIGGALMGAGIVGFSFSRWLALSMGCLTLTGMGGVLLMASSNTLVQTLMEDDKRGRVMSIFTMAFTGTMPIGNLVMGGVASRLGVRDALMASGIVCMLVVAIFYLRLPRLRQAAAPVLAKLDSVASEPIVYPGDENRNDAREKEGS